MQISSHHQNAFVDENKNVKSNRHDRHDIKLSSNSKDVNIKLQEKEGNEVIEKIVDTRIQPHNSCYSPKTETIITNENENENENVKEKNFDDIVASSNAKQSKNSKKRKNKKLKEEKHININVQNKSLKVEEKCQGDFYANLFFKK